eukprot:g9382.t1
MTAGQGMTGRPPQDQYDYLFKFIVIGDAGAGKSCLLHQFIEGKFKKSSSHTIGVEFGSKIIQVYDITNRETYQHLMNWLADARTLARADISIIAVGNKSDMKDRRAVTYLEASRCAQENDILFLETSALTGEGVEDVFIKPEDFSQETGTPRPDFSHKRADSATMFEKVARHFDRLDGLRVADHVRTKTRPSVPSFFGGMQPVASGPPW